MPVDIPGQGIDWGSLSRIPEFHPANLGGVLAESINRYPEQRLTREQINTQRAQQGLLGAQTTQTQAQTGLTQTETAAAKQKMGFEAEAHPGEMALQKESISQAKTKSAADEQALASTKMDFALKKQSYVNDQLAAIAFANSPEEKQMAYQSARQQAMKINPKFTQEEFPDEAYIPTNPDGTNPIIDAKIHQALVRGIGAVGMYTDQMKLMMPTSPEGKQAFDINHGYDVMGTGAKMAQVQAQAKNTAEAAKDYSKKITDQSSDIAHMQALVDQFHSSYQQIPDYLRGPGAGKVGSLVARVSGNKDAAAAIDATDNASKGLAMMSTALLKQEGGNGRITPALINTLQSATLNRQLDSNAEKKVYNSVQGLINLSQEKIQMVQQLNQQGITDPNQIEAVISKYAKDNPISSQDDLAKYGQNPSDVWKQYTTPSNIQKILSGTEPVVKKPSQQKMTATTADIQTTMNSLKAKGISLSEEQVKEQLKTKGYSFGD